MSPLTKIPVLDHGYLAFVDKWGSEEQIIEAARMSTDKGFQGWGPRHADACERTKAIKDCVFKYGPDYDVAAATECTCSPHPGDEKLLRYLWENAHQTPFEMAGLTIEVQAPIFVFREWHRHRVPFGYNELSARYTPMPDVNYVPSLDRCMLGSDGKNKQAGTVKDAAVLNDYTANEWQRWVESFYASAQDLYESGLALGIPKELARIVIPVGRYSRMRATGNLRGWLGFVALRDAPNAQWEIRQYAKLVSQLISEVFPRTHAIFQEARGIK